MKKLLTLVLVLALVTMPLSVVQAEEDETYKVAFICKGYTDMFCLSVMEYFEALSVEFEDLFEVQCFDGEVSSSVANDLIENCVTSGFDAIVFQQNDAEAPVEVVKKAVEAGVYVIVTTGHIEDDGESYYVDANPYQQGELVMQYAMEEGLIVEGTKVAIARGVDGNWHSDSRVEAFTDYIEEIGADLCGSEMCSWSKDTAMTAAQNWLVAIDDLEVILAACDDMAMGCIEAVKMAGVDVKVLSIDGSDAGIAAVADGSLMVTVQQDAEGYAYEALKMCAALLQGEEVENLLLDSWAITAENVDQF